MRAASTPLFPSGNVAPDVDDDDARLLARIKDGDHAAFAALLQRHSNRFYRVAYRFAGERAEAEDIVQEAFVKLWERPALWQPDRNTAFTTWFYRVVVNLSLDRQKKKRPAPLANEMQVADTRETHEEAMIRREREQHLETQIAALPKRQRVALTLCFYEGLSNQEAAEIMGIHLKALQSLLMRAKMKLKATLLDTGEL